MALDLINGSVAHSRQVSFGLRKDHFEDGAEDRLARSATYQETVNVLFLYECLCVRFRDGSTKENASLLGDFLATVVLEPAANQLSSLLCLIGTRQFARVQRPDRLVDDDALLPLREVHSLLDRLKLRKDNIVCLLGLALLQVLADAVDEAEVLLTRLLYFLVDYLLVFVEMAATLVVPYHDPLDLIISQLLRCNLTGERSATVGGDILGTDHHVVSDARLGEVDVQHAG